VSLRDQLLAKGLVSKKRAKHIERELKQQRKKKQSRRKKKKQVEREQQVRAEAEAQREREQRQAVRRAAAKAQEELQRSTRIRSLILGNRIRSRGRVPYWHKTLDSAELHRMEVSEGVAWALRAGEAAIVAHIRGLGAEPEYLVVNAGTARELLELAPERVVTFVRDTKGISAPDERFLEADWEISLVPRRAVPTAPPEPRTTS